MRKILAPEIRDTFIRFFEKNDHQRIPSSPLVPRNDPTLLYINSGMAPLKPYFVGLEKPPYPRMCNYQPCIRTNDIEDVGDRHHMTMFEMLGSWSIDDYYKQRAIELAWTLLTEEFGLPIERLYVTVFAGDKSKGIGPDNDSAKAWASVGVPEDRIVMLGEDNFWGPSGDSGPCGPCTEVFIDTGDAFGEAYQPGGHFDSESRYIEIWNAGVFMELNKNADGSFVPLPIKSVDTGSGLERMELALNGFESVYDTSCMQPIVAACQERFPSSSFGTKEYRILADHLRAATFIVAEGVNPASEGRGYIPRRLLRKCISIASRSDGDAQLLSEVLDPIIELSAPSYPQLKESFASIKKTFDEEVAAFHPVILKGYDLIDAALPQASGMLSAEFVFELVATHGVPVELVRDYGEKAGFSFDEAGFEQRFEEHQQISRRTKGKGAAFATDVNALSEDDLQGIPATVFCGYDQNHVDSEVIALFDASHQPAVALKEGEHGIVVVRETPFYAESGGQVGDVGTVVQGDTKAVVVDTQKVGDVFLHTVEVQTGSLQGTGKMSLAIDTERRDATRRNHSATHLLHEALRGVLPSGTMQKGSLVDSEKLRFDFQSEGKVSPDDLLELERRVNARIRENVAATTTESAMKDALAGGAIGQFGEKYADVVRVVDLGSQAKELCGGTHVQATGDIGLFLITGESAVAKGVRRIEAVTGAEAIRRFQDQRAILTRLSQSLKTPPAELEERLQTLQTQLKAKAAANPQASVSILRERPVTVQGKAGRLVEAQGSLKELRDRLDRHLDQSFVVMMSTQEDRISVMVKVKDADASELGAATIVQKLLPLLDGKGGGKPTFAQGGGKNLDALEKIYAGFEEILAT